MEPITLSMLFNKAWVFLIGLWWYDKRKTDRSWEILEGKISTLEKEAMKFVTEEQMKQAIKEALEPYIKTQEEIKVLLKDLNANVVSLSQDMAVQEAIKGLYEQKSPKHPPNI